MEVPGYPTRETRMSSGPRRSPAPAIPAGRGDGRTVTDPLPADASGQGRPLAEAVKARGTRAAYPATTSRAPRIPAPRLGLTVS